MEDLWKSETFNFPFFSSVCGWCMVGKEFYKEGKAGRPSLGGKEKRKHCISLERYIQDQRLLIPSSIIVSVENRYALPWLITEDASRGDRFSHVALSWQVSAVAPSVSPSRTSGVMFCVSFTLRHHCRCASKQVSSSCLSRHLVPGICCLVDSCQFRALMFRCFSPH